MPAASEPSAQRIRRFRQNLLDWFAHSGRHDLPWQHPATPYRVWVSEVMLQQTQVAVVIPYFQRFMQRFPDVEALAEADQDTVLAHWSGLGYYARARNLHAAAGVLRDQYDCQFPQSLETLQALPGIGRSTAGAILSLGCGFPAAILDGNVKRVLARQFAVEGWPGRSAVLRQLWQLAESHTPEHDCAAFNQAMMDLGATLCLRRNPQCEACPVADGCEARSAGTQHAYPGRKPARRLPVRSTRMLLLESEAGILLQRRPPAGLWGGLWSLPECPAGTDPVDWCREQLGLEVELPAPGQTFRHTFSHFHLDIEPLHASVHGDHGIMECAESVWYNGAARDAHGLAAPVQRLLEQVLAANR
ncbi:A/G-specific adenine glycosylase [Methylonatrum kenyense]|uniref:A/G-specific adenine glycosylase n=1 Tax=Methylonatrum kenyense TaxID=455253 RepID=UPI0020BEF7F5|nr:A/G-specific adenine glycosylase [Methylonatrum kenyense]MCK8516698.1 A/G-specific adenine glycosylase [Methylonatrum kenyense]